MQTKYLIEARIVPLFNLTSEYSELSLTISLPTKLIFIYSKDPTRKTKNKKRSVRRLMRWMMKGGVGISQREPEEIDPSSYQLVLLTEDNLKKILKDYKKLLNEILDYANNRQSSGSNVRERIKLQENILSRTLRLC